MKNWFYRLSRAKQIVLSVLVAHVTFVLFLVAQNIYHTWPTKKHKVIVNMVHITPPKATSPSAPSSQKLQSAAKKPAPVKKVPKSVKTAKETQAPQPDKLKKSEPQVVVEASLLKEIEACIETIAAHAPSASRQTTIHIPTLSLPTSTKTIEAETSDEIIAAFLGQSLTLPEFGEVRAFLAVDRWGHLQTLNILDAKSEKNAAFLKNRLPELQFPCLNEGVSLTVIFSNAL
jgi:hypothetical protein